MQEHYSIDTSEPGLLERRSWRWLRVRILGLLMPVTDCLFVGDQVVSFGKCESRLHHALFPPEAPK